MHTISFKHALAGIWHTIRTQPNLRFHAVAALFVCYVGWRLQLSQLEWISLSVMITWVITAEMINTSIEAMTDLITKEYRKEAKIAKDVAAGMVLVSAMGAAITGLIIFTPHLIQQFNNVTI